jgi:indolepyruvate ferredoxin oxidoreductase
LKDIQAVSLQAQASAAPVLRELELDDRFKSGESVVLLSGTQALVKVLLLQREHDHQSGVLTGGFVSGYRGSPLGGLDQTLWKASKPLAEAGIVFDPGVNEDLAATAVWGTQQLQSLGPAKVDGVFAMWYGKGPGVDRSGDPIKHGNYAGTHPRGGVIAVFGDDHPGKSSSIAHHSEQAMAAHSVPVFYPSNVEDIVRFGLLGFAMSRYSGCWTSMKVVNETAEQTATVEIGRWPIALPDPADLLPPEGVHCRGAYNPPARIESILVNHRLRLVARFARANRIDRVVIGNTTARLGLIAAGKSYQDTRQALLLLGIDDQRASAIGVALYKVGMIWPLEAESLVEFAQGKSELFCIEEKAAFLEPQVASILYNTQQRPRLVGKLDERGARLLSTELQLEPADVAVAIGRRLQALGLWDDALQLRVKELSSRRDPVIPLAAGEAQRSPYFCSGCPHSTSTNVPEGSFALAGIGCHAMAVFHKPRTLLPTHMGGEGMNWAGLYRFSKTRHVFQNLGDGTYFHSGLLAMRGAVASGASITYKILYNDAVAMTGGQPIDGPISVASVARQVLAEGVTRVVLVTDDPRRYKRTDLPDGVAVHHRDQLDKVQRELREVSGCTVLIYEQTCAAETRRRRKRDKLVDPPKRLFINDAVCEGCGDCSVQSGCISIEPLETALGRKRKINQSSCNKDYSCANGFCPSFVTVYGGALRRAELAAVSDAAIERVPLPSARRIDRTTFSIMVAGIGGTGVITVTAILAMAAHLEFKAASVYDMTGLAQKNGAVYSHLRIASRACDIASQRIGLHEADLVLAFDMLAGLADEAFRTFDMERTHFLGNERIQPTASFTKNPDDSVDVSLLHRRVASRVAQDRAAYVDATGVATALCGDAIAANMFLLGAAAQSGWLPVGVQAIERALELNGVQVKLNLRAFRLGRLWTHDGAAIATALRPSGDAATAVPQTFDEVVAHRSELLTAYQNAAYADRYRALVKRVADAETHILPGSRRLALAVADGFAKLMAYKDEYEVSRLYSTAGFRAATAAQFEGPYRLRVNLAPPLLSRRDRETGELQKREFGGWVLTAMRVLAPLRFLRGTWLDPFGYTHERRTERALVEEYETTLLRIARDLTTENFEAAVGLAQLPQRIRGYGHVKERHLNEVRQVQRDLLAEFTGDNRSPVQAQRLVSS